MASKKKRYDTRFPAGRVKKIMRMDDEVGKVAHAVPLVLSRAVEMFVNLLLDKTAQITQRRQAKTVTLNHLKQCILSEAEFDFLRDLVKDIPDVALSTDKEKENSTKIKCESKN